MADRQLQSVIKRNQEAWNNQAIALKGLHRYAKEAMDYAYSVKAKGGYIAPKQALILGDKMQKVVDGYTQVQWNFKNLFTVLNNGVAFEETSTYKNVWGK